MKITQQDINSLSVDEIAQSVGLPANELVEQTEKPAPKPQKEDYYP